jgi:hypothetical protein
MVETSKSRTYLALNGEGVEYRRKAMTIGELPLADTLTALDEATKAIAVLADLIPNGKVPYGSFVYTAFAGMNLAKQSSTIKVKCCLCVAKRCH